MRLIFGFAAASLLLGLQTFAGPATEPSPSAIPPEPKDNNNGGRMPDLKISTTTSESTPEPVDVTTATEANTVQPQPSQAPLPNSNCAGKCKELTVIPENITVHHQMRPNPVYTKCCEKTPKLVEATGALVQSTVNCGTPHLPTCDQNPVANPSGCLEHFQLYFMLDVRGDESNAKNCNSAFCNSRIIENSEMVKNWIFRVVYTIKKFKDNNPSQDFLVVVQYPKDNTNQVIVSYADEVLKAEKDFGDKIMEMTYDAKKNSRQNSNNDDLITALDCLNKYSREINKDRPNLDSVTCIEFSDAKMKRKLPNKNFDYKKILFTLTHGAVTVDNSRRNTKVLTEAKKVFDRMDVVTIEYRDSYDSPMFQSPNGITYEYADYTDLLRESEINTVVSNICEDLEDNTGQNSSPGGPQSKPRELVADPCLLDVVFAVDAHFCDCTTGLKDACCALSNKVIVQMKKYINSVVDKLRKKGGYVLGKDHLIKSAALRVGMYTYYRDGNVLKSDTVMDLTEWSQTKTTTSLDKFREKIFNGYKKPTKVDTGRHNKVFLREVLESKFEFSGSSLKSKFQSKFNDEKQNSELNTHSQVFVIFPEDDSSEEGDITNNLKLREGTLAMKKQGIDVIAMPIKSEEDVNRGLEYDAGLVNAILDTPPNGDRWTALDQVSNEYDEDRADRLVELIHSLDDCPPQQMMSPVCGNVEWSCTADMEYTWSGCLMGPAGENGENGKSGGAGNRGPTGFPGLNSTLGNPGVNGNDGAVGARGPPGPVGPRGDQGSIGIPGPPGDRGPAGFPGKNARIDIQSWSEVSHTVKTECGCKSCDKTVSNVDAVCTEKDGTTCMTKIPVWWLGEHIDRQYFVDAIKEFLGTDFTQQAVDHLTMHGLTFDRNEWRSYIQQVGVYLLGDGDYDNIVQSMR